MTAVFIHGVPETCRIWDDIRARIGDTPSIALALPGFGCPLPDGFDATKDAYLAWIVAELEKQSGPVDLVGHDWGSLFALRIASLRPDLVRSWTGGSATVRAVKVWHKLAQIWQTPGDGEAWMARADVQAFASILEGNGVPTGPAHATAERVDATMKEAILKLYRSAVDVGRQWEAGLAQIQSPGLMIWGGKDPLLRAASSADQEADVAMAPAVRFETCGHWWPAAGSRECSEGLAHPLAGMSRRVERKALPSKCGPRPHSLSAW